MRLPALHRALMSRKSFSGVLLMMLLEGVSAATVKVQDEAPDEVAGAQAEHLLLPLLAKESMAFQVPSLGSRAPAAPHTVHAVPRAATVMAEPPPPPPKRQGATVDQDGKSNVWAVEPAMQVNKDDKGLKKFLPVVGAAALAVVSVPLLPLLFATNPDQARAKIQRQQFSR